MTAADDAANPLCANVTVRLPDELDGLPARETNAQATGAWGDPTQVLLRCGVEVPGPSTLPCYELREVDWIIDEGPEDVVVALTYGRDPAVEVVIDKSITGPATILTELGPAVGSNEAERSCL